MTLRQSPPPIRHVRPPQFRAPIGSCDCHVHVVGPQTIYPLAPQAAVAMEDSTLADLRAVHATLGISRALIVGSGLHAFNYQHVLHALGQDRTRYRGVVILPFDITDLEISLLDQAGVVGARFYPGIAEIDERMLARVFERGWSAHFLIMDTSQLDRWVPIINAYPGRFVIEHAGLPDPREGVNGRHAAQILTFLDTDRCWIKLSPRFTKQRDLPYEDTLPFIHRLVSYRPDRLLYGSDYPHPSHWDPMPNEADLLDLMLLWAPDSRDQQRIMVENPEELFGFPTADESQK